MTTSLSTSFVEHVRREKEAFWRKHSRISEKEREVLWSQELLSTSAPTSLGKDHDTFGFLQSGQEVPRSFSSGVLPPGWHNTGFPVHAPISPSQPPQLKRDYSQQSAPAATQMMRSSTQSSSSGDGLLYGSSAPPQVMHWRDSYDDPPNAYTFSTPRIHRTGSGHRGLQQVVEQVLEVPGDYLARMETESDFTTPAPSQPALTTHTYDPPNKKAKRRSVCSEPAVGFSTSYGMSLSPQYPTPSLSSDLTNDTTVASQMSRQPSAIGSSVCGGLDMLRMNSCISSDYNLSGDSPQVAVTQSFDKSICNSAPFSDDSTFHHDLRYIGGVGDAARHSSFHYEYLDSTSLPSSQSTTKIAEDMTRSDSNSSASSKSSSKSNRSQVRLSEVAQASRALAPKQSDDLNMSRQVSSVSMVRIKSTTSSEGVPKFVAGIDKSSKPQYTRPKHARVFCNRCEDRTEGFRGEHELRRHADRAHAMERTVWVTTDFSAKEDPDQQPKVPLSSCKTCRGGKKYNQYYNAAAHLRRAHFNPKKNRKGKGVPADEERRGGKGGGDKPSMEVLKNWMKETTERVPRDCSEEAQPGPSVATATTEDGNIENENVIDLGENTFDQGINETSSSYDNKMEVAETYNNYSDASQAVFSPPFYWQTTDGAFGQFDNDAGASASLYFDSNSTSLFNQPHPFPVNLTPLNESTSLNDANLSLPYALQDPAYNARY